MHASTTDQIAGFFLCESCASYLYGVDYKLDEAICVFLCLYLVLIAMVVSLFLGCSSKAGHVCMKIV
jgi:hypothetical protein